jgi:hypothetical protein
VFQAAQAASGEPKPAGQPTPSKGTKSAALFAADKDVAEKDKDPEEWWDEGDDAANDFFQIGKVQEVAASTTAAATTTAAAVGGNQTKTIFKTKKSKRKRAKGDVEATEASAPPVLGESKDVTPPAAPMPIEESKPPAKKFKITYTKRALATQVPVPDEEMSCSTSVAAAVENTSAKKATTEPAAAPAKKFKISYTKRALASQDATGATDPPASGIPASKAEDAHASTPNLSGIECWLLFCALQRCCISSCLLLLLLVMFLSATATSCCYNLNVIAASLFTSMLLLSWSPLQQLVFPFFVQPTAVLTDFNFHFKSNQRRRGQCWMQKKTMVRMGNHIRRWN